MVETAQPQRPSLHAPPGIQLPLEGQDGEWRATLPDGSVPWWVDRRSHPLPAA